MSPRRPHTTAPARAKTLARRVDRAVLAAGLALAVLVSLLLVGGQAGA